MYTARETDSFGTYYNNNHSRSSRSSFAGTIDPPRRPLANRIRRGSKLDVSFSPRSASTAFPFSSAREPWPSQKSTREANTTGAPRVGHVDRGIPSRSSSRQPVAVGSIASVVSLVRHWRTSSRFIKPRPLSDFAPCRPARYYSPASWLIPPPGQVELTFHPPCYTGAGKREIC